MTEREYYRESDVSTAPGRRDIERETLVEPAASADDVAREVYQERVYGPDGEQVVRSEHISVPSEATRRAATVARINQIISFIFGAISVLLALRFLLLLLAANPASPFVSLIYGLSRLFVAPFLGIFSEPTFDGSVVEWSSLVGIIVYTLFAYGLTRLVELMYTPAGTTTTSAR